ncbi:MAG: hypothetical protein AVDCRST_MAG37-2539 [uncultured Rubrobacteraceae bacterium]|uniref:Uncharacterized protein n=1 Tax=uncultured Rubrobacteraceae bacterium TaxID=349277 RepID=A0A6J4QZQ6_9ACTN|nr:MAG: hypothetical protein AVDCRST_MAG37-2539 [uncultured Rubrobacteraceae bacterium]
MQSEDSAAYTYLTVPPDPTLRSCIGLVVAGLAARARIGVAGLEDAVELLEGQHTSEVPTRYRFSVDEDSLVAEIETPEGARGNGEPDGSAGWRTVVELVVS